MTRHARSRSRGMRAHSHVIAACVLLLSGVLWEPAWHAAGPCEPHSADRCTGHRYSDQRSPRQLVVPVAAQVRSVDVSKEELVVEFGAEAQVATSAGRWLDLLGESLTPANLHRIVLSSAVQTSLIYGSAIAYEPGAFDFTRHNITTGVPAPNGQPMRQATLNPQGLALYCPYAFRGADWTATSKAQAMDLAAAYDYSSADTEWFQFPRNNYPNVESDAASGHWSEPYFDEGAGNISMTTYSVAFSTETNLTDIGAPYNPHTQRWFLGVTTVDVPLSAITTWQRWQYPTSLVAVVVVGLVATVAVISVIAAAIVKHRRLPVMRASSPTFNLIMLVGAVLTSASALTFVLLPTRTNGICQLRVSLATMGVVTILAPLFAKTYRIARLFDNPKFKKLNLRDKYLLKPTVLIIVLEGVLVAAWLIVGGDQAPTYTEREAQIPDLNPDNPFFKIATCTESNGGMAATGLLFLLLIVGGTWFAYRARKAPVEYNDTPAILACIAFMAFYAVCLVPVFFLIRNRSFTGSSMLRSVGLLVGCWLMLAFLFIPKMFALRRVIRERAATHRRLTAGKERIGLDGRPRGGSAHVRKSVAMTSAPTLPRSSSEMRDKKARRNPMTSAASGSGSGSGRPASRASAGRRSQSHDEGAGARQARLGKDIVNPLVVAGAP